MAQSDLTRPASGGRPLVLAVGRPDAPHWQGLRAIENEAEVVVGDDPATLERYVPSAEVFFLWVGAPSLEPYWARATKARWVHSCLAGVDRLLFPAFVESDVPLTNSRGIFGEALAEYALAAVLYFAKRMPEMAAHQRAKRWQMVRTLAIAGKAITVVGLGDIGSTVARKANALGMRVTGVRRSRLGEVPPYVERIVPMERLTEALSEADFVVMTLPLTAESHHLIGARELAAMKEGAVLVNVGRGGTLDEAALVEALRSGHLGGAALDVFEKEPLAPESPLWEVPNLFISAHTVDNVAGWEDRVVDLFITNFRRYRQGQPLLHVVDKRRGY